MLAIATVGSVIAVASGASAPGVEPARTPTAAPNVGAELVMGADEPSRPRGSGRVVRVFDFEEREFNSTPVPKDWFRAQDNPPERSRPGFPPYNQAAFDFDVGRTRPDAKEPGTSVRLSSNGGSTSLRLASRALPIFPRADYLLSAAIRTTPLTAARAFVSVRMLDERANPIPGSELRSAPVVSPDEWTLVSLEVPGRVARAAYMQIDLELLQPEQYDAQPVLGRHAVRLQDYGVSAWFDDVAVFQLPRVELSPEAGNVVVVAPRRPALNAIISDLTGQNLSAKLSLIDVDGNEVVSETRAVPPGGARFTWQPTLKRYGWFRARMEIVADQAVVGSSESALIWAPPVDDAAPVLAQRPGTPAFVVVDEALDPGAYDQLPGAMRGLGLKAAAIGVLPEALDELRRRSSDASTSAPPAPVRVLLDALLNDGVEVGVAFPRVPDAVARELRLDPADPQALLSHDPKHWQPPVQAMLDLYGQRISRWQLGTSANAGLDAPEPRSAPSSVASSTPAPNRSTTGATATPARANEDRSARLATFRALVAGSVPGSISTLAWRGEYAWPASKSARTGARGYDALTLMLPLSFALDAIAPGVRGWLAQARSGATELTLRIETPDPGSFGQRAGVVELVKRTALAWQALTQRDPQNPAADQLLPLAPRLALGDAWRLSSAATDRLVPHATLATWSVLSERLRPRVALAQLASPPGTKAILFGPGPGTPRTEAREPGAAGDADSRTRTPGIIIAWSNIASASSDAGALAGYFASPGQALRLTDAFGNSTELRPIDASGAFRVPLSPEPIIIENVDSDLALFTSGFKVSPSFVPAIAAMHEHELELSNPFPVRITGEIQLPAQQAGVSRRPWTFQPTGAMAFSIAPGQTQRIPFAFAFAASEEAGPRTLTAIVNLTASRTYPTMRLQAPIVIGLESVDMNVSASRSPGPDGPDVSVVATITNTGKLVKTMQIDCVALGRQRQQQPLSNLGPGESATRRFVFSGAAKELASKRVRVTLLDVDGAERLNRFAQVP